MGVYMKSILYAIGVITIGGGVIGGIILGAQTGSTLFFILFLSGGIIAGVVGASLYLGIATVLDNQEKIIGLMSNSASDNVYHTVNIAGDSQDQTSKDINEQVIGNTYKHVNQPKKKVDSVVSKIRTKRCTKCKKEIDDSYDKCPHCKNVEFE